jgi:antitoxin component of MazEF toxin-antitoxin module
MRQKILKTGNSLAVTIPANFVKILGLRSGMEVVVKPDIAKGLLKCTFAGTGQLPLLTSPKKS